MKKALLSFLLLLFAGSFLFAQNESGETAESLKAKLFKAKEDTDKVDLLNKLSFLSADVNPTEGVRYGQQSIALALSLGDTHRLAEAYSITGTNYSSLSDYSSALNNHFKSLTIREALGEKNNIAVCLNNIGIIYDTQHDYPKALDYYQRARITFEELGNKHELATVLGNLGLVQNALGNYDEALESINKALIMEEGLKDSSAMASCVGNIGTVYYTQKQYEKALEYYLKGLTLTSTTENKLGQGIAHCNIGEVYYLMAVDSNSSPLQKLFNGKKDVALKQATENLQQAETIFKMMGINNGLTEVYDYMSRIKLEQGDYKNALHLFKLHIAYRDSVFSEEDKAQIARIEKGRTEDIKQKEIEIQKLQLEKVQNERLYFMGGIILLLLLSGVLYNRFRLREKSNEKIQAAYDNLKQTQQQLIQSEKMASLGQLSVGLAHEIQNPLNFVKNFSELSEELVDEFTTVKTDEERKEIGKYLKLNLGKITEHGNRVGSIIKGMLLSLHTAAGEKVLTDINKLCADHIDIAYKAMAGNYPGFKCKVDKMLDPQLPPITVVPQDISRVVLNMTKNAFAAIGQKQKSNLAKTGWQPTVTIATRFMSSTERNKQGAIEIIIRDNGAGIAENIKQKIFEPFFSTSNQQGATGLGLSVCYDIVKTYWGDITVESKENEFTKFVVSIPL